MRLSLGRDDAEGRVGRLEREAEKLRADAADRRRRAETHQATAAAVDGERRAVAGRVARGELDDQAAGEALAELGQRERRHGEAYAHELAVAEEFEQEAAGRDEEIGRLRAEAARAMVAEAEARAIAAANHAAKTIGTAEKAAAALVTARKALDETVEQVRALGVDDVAIGDEPELPAAKALRELLAGGARRPSEDLARAEEAARRQRHEKLSFYAKNGTLSMAQAEPPAIREDCIAVVRERHRLAAEAEERREAARQARALGRLPAA